MGPLKAPKYVLHYFNARGRAEIIRMLLAVGKCEFEDQRYEPEEWARYKPDTPFGCLPVLEVDGVSLCQSGAIIGYLGREFGLMGSNSLEAAKVQMIIECMDDAVMPLVRVFSAKTDEEKGKHIEEFVSVQLPKFLKFLTEQLEEGKHYLVGDQLTAADIAIARCLSDIPPNAAVLLTKHPEVSALVKRTLTKPEIAKWIETRPVTNS